MQVDMPALVSKYLQLKKSGSVWQGICPFHDDNDTPSFTVYSNDAYCFGCAQYFGPVKFLKEFLHISKEEALEKLGYPQILVGTFKKPQPKVIVGIPLSAIRTWHSMLRGHRDYFHSRLFTDETIDRELWGWDGNRYVMTVWDKEPGVSSCVSVRRRASKPDQTPKYLGLKDCNPKVLYNMWTAKQYYQTLPTNIPRVIYIFFGEYDCALATQDGFPAVSPTNGQNAWEDSWDKEFEGYSIVVVPDRGEEYRGFRVASHFPHRASVLKWPEAGYDDYNSFRLAGGSAEDFLCEVVSMSVAPSYAVECFWETVEA